MASKNKGQISTEYLIIVGFVTFIVILLLGVALFYTSQVKDGMKDDQIERFAKKVISSAESVYFSGEPSRTTVSAYLPAGVSGLEISGNEMVFNVSFSSGFNRVSYRGRVPMEGSFPVTEGIKSISLVATSDRVLVSGS